jgi:hypothetical protein
MIYGVRSRISLYCIRRRMVRLSMRVALLPLVALRLTPVLVLAKIMLFSFGTKPLRIRATDCTLNMTNVATASVFHIFAGVKPIIYEKPNLVLKFKSISII